MKKNEIQKVKPYRILPQIQKAESYCTLSPAMKKEAQYKESKELQNSDLKFFENEKTKDKISPSCNNKGPKYRLDNNGCSISTFESSEVGLKAKTIVQNEKKSYGFMDVFKNKIKVKGSKKKSKGTIRQANDDKLFEYAGNSLLEVVLEGKKDPKKYDFSHLGNDDRQFLEQFSTVYEEIKLLDILERETMSPKSQTIPKNSQNFNRQYEDNEASEASFFDSKPIFESFY